MSFICAVTRKASAKGVKPTRLVVETRPQTYTNINPDGDVITSYGVEVVREINVSNEGLAQLERIRDIAAEDRVQDGIRPSRLL